MRNSQKRESRLTLWQVCVSVLLIGLVLYNPFLVLGNQADGLAYQSMARHRATVGASEMQHFTPVRAEQAQAEATVEEIATELVVEKKESPAAKFHEEALPPEPELIARLWIRPPPSLQNL